MNDENTMKEKISLELYDTDALKKRLEELALQGWKLKALYDTSIFEKTEPKKLIYSVQVFEEWTETKDYPNPKMLEYIEYCKSTGWEYVSHYGYFVIFVTDRNDLIPIMTDENLKFKIIKKKAIKSNFLYWFIIPVLFLILIVMDVFNNFSDIISKFTQVMFFLNVFIQAVIQISKFSRWNRKVKKNLAQYGRIQLYPETAKKYNIFNWINNGFITFGLLWFIIVTYKNGEYAITVAVSALLIIFYLIKINKFLVNKAGYDRAKSRKIIVLFNLILIIILVYASFTAYQYLNKQPIPQSEINIEFKKICDNIIDQNNWSHTEYMVFSSLTRGYLSAEEASGGRMHFYYSVFRCKWYLEKSLYVLDEKIGPEIGNYTVEDASVWGANAVYKEKDDYEKTIVVFNDVVFTYYGDIELDADGIVYIKEAIGVK